MARFGWVLHAITATATCFLTAARADAADFKRVPGSGYLRGARGLRAEGTMGTSGQLPRSMAAIACLLLAGQVDAAEIRRDPSREGRAVFEGRIERGDYDKLRAFLREGPEVHEIYLASPGGLIGEAFKLGHLIRLMRIATIVPGDVPTGVREKLAKRYGLKRRGAYFKCASACFFLFVGGVNRRRDVGERPWLGIHRPHILDKDLKRRGMDRATWLKRSREDIEGYLTVMGVPRSYVEQMFLTPRERMRWISKQEFDSELAGLIPQVRDQFAAKCDKRTEQEKEIWQKLETRAAAKDTAEEKAIREALLKKQEEQRACERNAQVELATTAIQRFRNLTGEVKTSRCPDVKPEEEPAPEAKAGRGSSALKCL